MENNFKYIVYCTTNKVNNKIYIGVHKTLNPDIFDNYLGCGVHSNIPSSYNNPKTKFQYAVKKYGPKNFYRTIIKVFDNEEEAFLLEAEIVDVEFLKRTDVYNMVTGGIVREQDVSSQKTYKYSLCGEFIAEYKSISDAARLHDRNMRSVWRAIKEKIKCAGFFWSDKKYDKLDLTYYKTENEKTGITVYQYSSTGEFECSYDSISIASKVNNVNSRNLSTAIKLGTKCNNKYFLTYYAQTFSIAKTDKVKNTTVYQYDLDGNFIKEWPSAIMARKELGFTTSIWASIKLGRTAGCFQWSVEKLDKMPKSNPKTGKAKIIEKYDKEGNLVKTYNSLAECKKENGSGVQHSLNGRDKYHKGFVYKYKY